MILNVSSRTDIVALYSEWFLNRLKVGYVDVRNPFYPNQVSRILLDREHIDAIIFCTKNPIPMLSHLKELETFPYLFQVTITPYQHQIEPFVPKKSQLIEAIKTLSCRLGRNRVIIRYDPILLNPNYTIDYHKKVFTSLCKHLEGYVNKVIISFIDFKKNTLKHQAELQLEEIDETKIKEIARNFGVIAKLYHMQIQSCGEPYDLSDYGITNDSCINEVMMYELTGQIKNGKHSKNRKDCHCMESVDIGAYNTCSHRCLYCYANYDEKKINENMQYHNPNSSFLIGNSKIDDVVKIRVG